MKKNFMRLCALLMCMVMVLCMVPAKAHAVELEGNQMPMLKSISMDSYGDYHFTTFADLQKLATQAMSDPYSAYMAYYDGYNALYISSNLTIPSNMVVLVYENDMTIPSGVTMAIDGGYVYVEDEVTINGTLNIGNNGELGYTNILKIYGQLNLDGCLSGRDCDALIYGEDRMSVGPNAYFYINEWDATAADISQMCIWGDTGVDNLYVELYVEDPVTVFDYLTIPVNTTIFVNNTLTLHGDVQLYGSMVVQAPLNMNGVVMNYGGIDVYYDYGGRANFAQPEAYNDSDDEDMPGVIWVNSYNSSFPADALGGLNVNSFTYVDYYDDYEDTIPYWGLMGYLGAHQHTVVTDPALAPTCLTYGFTEGSHCATCGETLVQQEALAPLGHYYGLDAKGNIDFYDETCDTCGARRIVNPTRLTHSMYRMFNPNTGEHFYTGSMEERQMLEAAGWKYEGVGFTFPANTGAPVYRLFQPSTGEHLYTMSEAEVEFLVSQGWNMEGIAFNSGNENEVPQYRLHNPNVNVGAYHFTASVEEKDVLLAAGWEYQGIGFYTCWQ